MLVGYHLGVAGEHGGGGGGDAGGQVGGNSDPDSASSDTLSDCADPWDTDEPDVEIQCVQLHETLSHLSLYGTSLHPIITHQSVSSRSSDHE